MERALEIVFVLYPNITQLDFTGPLQVLSRLEGAHCHLAAKTMAPVASDSVLTLNPTITFDTCPEADLLCVPGGFGTAQAVNDPDTIDFVRQQGANATYITSVCTGAFTLGAAGLLKGKKATTHWAYHHLLPIVGAKPTRERVVRDGNVITGGGVTAGIDFAFEVVAEHAGDTFAQALQLGLEYDPAPRFNAGAPGKAPAAIEQRVTAFYQEREATFRAELERAMSA